MTHEIRLQYLVYLRLQAGVTIMMRSQSLLVLIKIFDDSVRIVITDL